MSHATGNGCRGEGCKFTSQAQCNDAYADWQASEQVRLARHIVAQGRAGAFRKSKTVFDQLVMVVAGEQPDIMSDGNPGTASFTRRLRKALGGGGGESNPAS